MGQGRKMGNDGDAAVLTDVMARLLKLPLRPLKRPGVTCSDALAESGRGAVGLHTVMEGLGGGSEKVGVRGLQELCVKRLLPLRLPF